MPPKRAAKAAAKPQPASNKKATTATRSTRSRAQKETPPQEEAAEDTSMTRSTRTRKSTAGEKDVPVATTPETTKEDAPAPRTVQRPLTRGRPPRTVKKAAPSQVNKGALDALKKRMEEDRRANQAGVVPQPVQETREQEAERRIGEAENNDGDAALVPAARPVAVPRSPSQVRQTAVPGTAVKAPGTVQRPQSAVKMQSTPGAETSVLALQNFRRRARQPSLLQMVQNPDLAPEGDETTEFTLGMSDDEEEEFAPHDEGTPLQKAKARQAEAEKEQEEEVAEESVIQRAQTPPSLLQVEPEEDDLYGATPQRSRGRKRKSDALEDESEIQVIRSSPSLPSPSRELSEQQQDFEPIPATAPEVDEEEPATTESQQRRLLSDTYADPVSSSPPPSPISPSSPQEQRPRQPTASPTTTRKSNRGNPSSKSKPMTTAALRALLPKRRSAHARNDYDIPSSSSAETTTSFSDDSRRGAKKARTKKPPQSKKKGALSPVAPRKKTTAPTNKKQSTYSRGGSNKENQIHISSESSELSELNSDDIEDADQTADTSVSTIGADKKDDGISAEMRKAREKFADVDNWEMEFESASLGAGGNSSPWR